MTKKTEAVIIVLLVAFVLAAVCWGWFNATFVLKGA